MIRPVVIGFLLGLLAVACGGSSPPATARPAERTAAALEPRCHRHFERERTCVKEYLSALLDVRVELNMPPGIGQEVETEGRDAVLEKSYAEWQRDTAPAKIAATCKEIATKTPPEVAERLHQEADECAATTDCIAFAACVVAQQRSWIASGGTH